jgi:hypothetical protein
MRFLYHVYIPKGRKVPSPVVKPRSKAHRKVNFEDMRDQWQAIGRKAEEFALAWEKQRLVGADLAELIDTIDDRRDRPSFGYDFLSHSAARQPRYIEVKSVARLKEGHRFFLSDNEYDVSHSQQHRDSYYFYLVSFDSTGEPEDLIPVLASELYEGADLEPSAYAVRLISDMPPKVVIESPALFDIDVSAKFCYRQPSCKRAGTRQRGSFRPFPEHSAERILFKAQSISVTS